MVARTVLLQFWWPTRRRVDRQERVPSKGKSVAPVFFQRRALVLRGFSKFRAWVKGMSRAPILCAVRATSISKWFFNGGRGVHVGWFVSLFL